MDEKELKELKELEELEELYLNSARRRALRAIGEMESALEDMKRRISHNHEATFGAGITTEKLWKEVGEYNATWRLIQERKRHG